MPLAEDEASVYRQSEYARLREELFKLLPDGIDCRSAEPDAAFAALKKGLEEGEKAFRNVCFVAGAFCAYVDGALRLLHQDDAQDHRERGRKGGVHRRGREEERASARGDTRRGVQPQLCPQGCDRARKTVQDQRRRAEDGRGEGGCRSVSRRGGKAACRTDRARDVRQVRAPRQVRIFRVVRRNGKAVHARLSRH